MNPIKKYIRIAVVVLFLVVIAAGFYYKQQYEKSIADLAVAEQSIKSKENKIKEIEQDVLDLSKDLSAANDVIKNIKEQKEKTDRDVAVLRKKLKEFEFDRIVKEDKPKAESFINDEYINLLNCIENSSGKVDSKCAKQ